MSTARVDALVLHRVNVERFATHMLAALFPILDKAEGEIEAKLAMWDADTEAGFTSATRQQLVRLLAQIRAINEAAHLALYAKLRGDLVDFAKYEAQVAQGIAAGTSQIGTAFNVPSSSLLKSLVEQKPFQGRMLKDWVTGLAEGSTRRVMDAVTQGVVQGESIPQIVKRVSGTKALNYKDGVTQVSQRQTEAVVRGATAAAHNTAHEEFAKANPQFYKGIRWISTLDNKTCKVCAGYAGDIFPVDAGPRPPAHWNCLPGDALVTTQPISAASKREFDGQLVVIRTASGLELSCTPNHPVLCDDGWRPAHRVDETCCVVCDLRGQRVALADGEHQNRIARIQDVAEPFLASEMVVTMPVPLSAKDFHGDAVENQIAVIGTNSLLGDAMKASLHQESLELPFQCGTMELLSLAGLGHLGQLLQAAFTTSHSVVGVGGETLSLSYACAAHAKGHASTPVSKLNPATEQNALDGSTRDAEFYGDLLRSASPGVFLDNVVSVERRNFRGHVYNLETENHLIVAQGIVTHNCRCTIEAIPLGSPVEAAPTYERWLAKQPDDVQKEVLGAARYTLWKQGGLPLKSFAVDGQALSLEQIKERDYQTWLRLWPDQL